MWYSFNEIQKEKEMNDLPQRPYIPPVKCVKCGKVLEPIEPDRDYGMVHAGIVGQIHAPYGSENDGTIYQIGICDECIKATNLKPIGDYLFSEHDEEIRYQAKMEEFERTGTYITDTSSEPEYQNNVCVATADCGCSVILSRSPTKDSLPPFKRWVRFCKEHELR